MASGIYAIIHRESGRWYVGQSQYVSSRISKHKSDLRFRRHHSPYLQRVWDKYGEDAFDFEVLIVAPVWALHDLEQAYLDDPETSHFNSAKDATAPGRGRKLSPEHRSKISESTRIALSSPDVRARLSDAQRGRKHTPETRAKMSASSKGRPKPPEVIAKMVATRRANGSYGPRR